MNGFPSDFGSWRDFAIWRMLGVCSNHLIEGTLGNGGLTNGTCLKHGFSMKTDEQWCFFTIKNHHDPIMIIPGVYYYCFIIDMEVLLK